MRMAGCTSHSVDWLFLRIHSGCIQALPTLNLVRDYVRFIITFFEAINTSAPHIYHSAIFLSPRTSITHEMHKQHARPLARIVQGISDSWEPVVATANFDEDLNEAVWSPCNRFIAVATSKFAEVLDAVTLSRLSIFDHSSYISSHQLLGFSPDSRCLTLFTGERLVSWDLQTGGPLGTILSGLGHQHTVPFSFKHSQDGKVVAVAYKSRDSDDVGRKYDNFINTYDLLSGERVGSCRVPEGRMIYPIWTHDGYLQFATIDSKLIRIWESTFTLEPPPGRSRVFPRSRRDHLCEPFSVPSLPLPTRLHPQRYNSGLGCQSFQSSSQIRAHARLEGGVGGPR